MRLDETDIRLLTLLQEDAKANVKALADKLGLSKSPVYERIRRYEEQGLIERYVAVLGKRLREESMVVFCSVSLESQKLKAIEQFSAAVMALPEVLECYLMGGANDFLLKVHVKDLKAYHQFSSGTLAALPNVSEIKSTFVLNEVKRSMVLPVDAS